MDADHAKKMMDAFYEAKRIRDQLPPLPEGVNPSYINTLDAILQLSAGKSGAQEPCREEDQTASTSFLHPADVLKPMTHTEETQSTGEGGIRPVRISDVANFQRLPRPAVTRTLKEMESQGLVTKVPDATDHRVVHLEVTPRGQELYQTYVVDYFGMLIQKLAGISNEEVETMVRTIRRIDTAMR